MADDEKNEKVQPVAAVEEKKSKPEKTKETKKEAPAKASKKETTEEKKPSAEEKETAPDEPASKGRKIEVSSEKAFDIVEAVKASGKIRKGINEVTKSMERGEAKLVVVAKDISPPEVVMHLPLLAKEKGIPFVEVDTKEELGAAAGLEVPTSCIAVISEGEAKDSIKELKGD